ncbi:hypothetical protein NM688_g2325 [Phlebia brevispora]|uniref:Uncharacterized protein n=1 Tax=Phlebia brevispora TaxID=194682 RepID=A0ACC1T973_9APHY|nr:hypothetical protein NM688_g2325 [Phlebia brevispora]
MPKSAYLKSRLKNLGKYCKPSAWKAHRKGKRGEEKETQHANKENIPVVETDIEMAEPEECPDTSHESEVNSSDLQDSPMDAFGTETIASMASAGFPQAHENFLPPISQCESRGTYELPPSLISAQEALADLTELLHPRRKRGGGVPAEFEGDRVLRMRLTMMEHFLWAYVDPSRSLGWIKASVEVANSFQRKGHTARSLRTWTRAWIDDPLRLDLPFDNYGIWTSSLLQKGELATELLSHLQGIGKYVHAVDIVEYCDHPEVKAKYGLKHTVSLATAKRWMYMMDYRWTKTPSGQYVDGHEREDVVAYRQETFLPSMEKYEGQMRVWDTSTGEETVDPEARAQASDGTDLEGQPRRRVVLWYHDESTFYAHDRRTVYWVHKTDKAVPKPKGEGSSIMVADFVSADYGWLRSPDGHESARVLFKAGKNRDGYFTNEEIRAQAKRAREIILKYYPNDNHIFIYDNAPTHVKRAADTISARKMPKGPNGTFGVDQVVRNSDGKPTSGKITSLVHAFDTNSLWPHTPAYRYL